MLFDSPEKVDVRICICKYTQYVSGMSVKYCQKYFVSVICNIFVSVGIFLLG